MNYMYIRACSKQTEPLRRWVEPIVQKAYDRGIECVGGSPEGITLHRGTVYGEEYYTVKLRIGTSDRTDGLINDGAPDGVHSYVTFDNEAPKFEFTDIVPDERSPDDAPPNTTPEIPSEGELDGDTSSTTTREKTTAAGGEPQAQEPSVSQESISSGTVDTSDLATLRKEAERAAVEEVQESASTGASKDVQYTRSTEVKRYVEARANGVCEGCQTPAPFISKTGKPYLHVHHIHELSGGGSDTPDTVVALCPNCHYRVHHGEGGEEYNRRLLEIVQAKENGGT